MQAFKKLCGNSLDAFALNYFYSSQLLSHLWFALSKAMPMHFCKAEIGKVRQKLSESSTMDLEMK